jgi:hypothetical protein
VAAEQRTTEGRFSIGQGTLGSGRVFDAKAHLHEPADTLSRNANGRGNRPALTGDTGGSLSTGAVHDFCLHDARKIDRLGILAQAEVVDCHIRYRDILRHGLIPCLHLTSVHGETFATEPLIGPARSLQRTALQLKAAHPNRQPRRPERLQHAFGLRMPRIRATQFAVLARRHNTKLPSKLVFDGRRTIRVQNVSLVHHGVGDGLNFCEA